MERLIRVGITQGDFNGVGLEVALKAISDETLLELMTPVLFADWRLVEYARKTLALELPATSRVKDITEVADGRINVIDLHLDDTTIEAGKPSASSGAGAVAALEKAMSAISSHDIDVLVTAPISKEASQGDTFHYNGHTEYLGAKAGEGARPQMILFDDYVRVALVTTHLPLAEVPRAITRDSVADAVCRFAATLVQDFGIPRPKIAVLSLNPHCGDGGLLGKEENEHIVPAIEECNSKGILAFGPYAADGFFGSGAYIRFDGVLAMYHDQGLTAFKALARENGVNYTAGLPFVRTSPDHGTACDIAWKGKADPTSMREAIYKAIDIFRCRRNSLEASSNPLRHQTSDRPKKEERAQKPHREDNNSITWEENSPALKNSGQKDAADNEENAITSRIPDSAPETQQE